MTLLGMTIIALSIGSLWLNGLAIYLWSQGEHLFERRFRKDEHFLPLLPTTLTLLWLALMLSLMFQAGELPEFDAVEMLQVVQSNVVESLLVSVVILFTLFLGVRHRYELAPLGFRSDNLPQQLNDGFRGFVLAFVPVSLVLLLTSALRTTETMHPFLRLMNEGDIDEVLLWVAFSAIITAPLKEELMFRVILQTWLTNYLKAPQAIVLGALIFAGVHGFPDALGIFPLALVLGYVYHRTRSFLAVFLLHALFNAYNVAAMLVHVLDKAAS